MSIERWKQIKDYPDYFVSSYGRIKSHRWGNRKAVLKPMKHSNGYSCIYLYKDGEKRKSFKIHRLVAIAFIENKENKECVNHMDGNKKNNNVKNLEWATKSENLKHAYRKGLKSSNLINAHKSLKIWRKKQQAKAL